ncbi:MAG: P1 family peptidase [Atopobium sp.]|uniref:P1 family peptidase n=1 Tax=Atopobium sp. TaxID=1872650 RepID=UPI002A7ECCA2|nr:P1 family peptidase [Atopobium sp.]MDY4522178.1 P1 family peptidase [Atopobium sp.]
MGLTSITQIPGIYAAHYTNEEAATGCTVIICPDGATGGVDVRGGAPATRETDLLRPEETVNVLHSVVLSGGSAYGLECMSGVAHELEKRGIGLNVGVGIVPIVSGACIFDLACGSFSVRPTLANGMTAAATALDNNAPLERGNVGAGTGATVGKLAGPSRTMKGGFGENVQVSGELICGAVAAVNACGDVIDPVTNIPVAGMLDKNDPSSIANTIDALTTMAASMPLSRTNTTISCVVTNAKLTKAQATKVAQMSADAYAHTIKPTHTTNDGDTIFVMATGQVEVPLDVVGVLATQALEQAIIDGVSKAKTAYGFIAAHDL